MVRIFGGSLPPQIHLFMDKCRHHYSGFTPQYAGLQKIWDTFQDKDFVLLGFPSNQVCRPLCSKPPTGEVELNLHSRHSLADRSLEVTKKLPVSVH